MSWFKLGGGILAGLALLAAAWLIRDRFHQKALADAAAECAAAAADPADAAELTSCLLQIRLEVRAARQERLCQQALLPALRPESRFAMQQACGAGTKRLVAVGDVLERERDGLKVELAASRADLGKAVERAEARAGRRNEREGNGRTVIQTAPRDAGGSIVCDAVCLQRLGT